MGGGEGKERNRENCEEGCIIQERGAGGHGQEVGSKGREQCLDFRSILKAGSTGFPNGIGAGFER